mmetsp:Transcript_43706/g.105988  ORF Transcript_43706/g.105988 Transcript_43706/m.105988 type:complete len:110 (-) Transcript_43706:31-360(-)
MMTLESSIVQQASRPSRHQAIQPSQNRTMSNTVALSVFVRIVTHSHQKKQKQQTTNNLACDLLFMIHQSPTTSTGHNNKTCLTGRFTTPTNNTRKSDTTNRRIYQFFNL